ncbi:DUF1631 family protein [Ramlibacter tataouinensis]|uniref:DUF1631 family protein n=1 Tax=Ramlibacter tataouinensis TaxID=94132 RepID=UPI0022F3F6C3|nr:DUF1631 family protein [Ramlibacter tataouinensis]WBY02618.1 DUF1631 family protein [Ramlibacter tataouinensis]
MAKMLPRRIGVADDPTALQPSLNDCLDTMLEQAQPLMAEVVQALVRGAAPVGPQSVGVFQQPGIQQAIAALDAQAAAVQATYQGELTRIAREGGGKDQVPTEVLRYEDLQLFGDDELDQSIEVARALQEVSFAVDDVLPTVDALVSTLLGWRTIQPGLNPLRPEVFVRALQSTLAAHVPDAQARETLIAPAAGMLGSQLRRLYRELSDWLLSTGVEPAVPIGGKLQQGSGAQGKQAAGSMARTLLTLDRLRKLLAGDFDQPGGKAEFLHTVPASMALLQELKQVDTLVKRLEQRPKATPAAPARPVAEHEPAPPLRLGHQLGDEVLRLMFETLAQDERLLPGYKEQLRVLQPVVQKLAQQDSRFFSDREHPARQLLDRVTQRSLAFKRADDEGWSRFLDSVQYASRWLAGSKVVDADTFGELLAHLQKVWAEQDQSVRQRREDGARALLHAEQRNLLAQKLAAEFAQAAEGLDVAAFVADFLKGSWSQVVAEAQLTCTDGSDDPFGYRALVDDLVWSVQKSTSQQRRAHRLARMVPALVAKLREGLARIAYPAELTERFFDNLGALHAAALQGAQEAARKRAAELESEPRPAGAEAAAEPWLADSEVQESGWLGEDSLLPQELAVAGIPFEDSGPAEPVAAGAGGLRTGTWAELVVEGRWTRVQLTWASPHGTLFMFTSLAGTAHSMSRRTLERLRGQGLLRVVADRPVVDDALDQVAKAALKNSLAKE